MARPITDPRALEKRLVRDGIDPNLVTLAEVRHRSMPHWSQTGIFVGDKLIGVYGQRRDGRIQSAISYPSELERWSVAMKRNPQIGSLMEGFSDLLKGRAKVDMTLGKVSVELAYRDEDGDLTLDVLRLKKGRTYAAAAAGELGRFASAGIVFREHNTYVKPAFRGQGLMLALYKELLIANGAAIVSDEWNHSEPMRRVWMKLSASPGIFVFSIDSIAETGLLNAAGKPFDWDGYDSILIAVAAGGEAEARHRAITVLSELGTDWSPFAVEDYDRFADDGTSSWL